MKGKIIIIPLLFSTMILLLFGCQGSEKKYDSKSVTPQEALLYKMLNYTDYFKTLKGNCTLISIGEDLEEQRESFKIETDLEHKYMKIESSSKFNQIAKDGTEFLINVELKEYKEYPIDDNMIATQDNKIRALSLENRKDELAYRDKTYTMIIDKQESILLSLRDCMDEWVIIKEHEIFLNRNCLILESNKNFSIKSDNRLLVKSIFIVDEETGMVLKLVDFDQNGNIIDSFEFDNIILNEVFSEHPLDLKGYTKVDNFTN